MIRQLWAKLLSGNNVLQTSCSEDQLPGAAGGACRLFLLLQHPASCRLRALHIILQKTMLVLPCCFSKLYPANVRLCWWSSLPPDSENSSFCPGIIWGSFPSQQTGLPILLFEQSYIVQTTGSDDHLPRHQRGQLMLPAALPFRICISETRP